MAANPRTALVLNLSTLTRAFVEYRAGGVVETVTFVRGREAYAIDSREAKKLLDALRPERAA